MERFVQAIIGGGVMLIIGLWFITLLKAWSPLWLLGASIVLLGLLGLAGGIWVEIEY